MLVEHEEGDGVGAEGFADAEQKLLEQLVELQVREGRIGNGLHPTQLLTRSSKKLSIDPLSPVALGSRAKLTGSPLFAGVALEREDREALRRLLHVEGEQARSHRAHDRVELALADRLTG